ncbi:MAG: glycoside hydrolase [Gemmatimonadales bacterium]
MSTSTTRFALALAAFATIPALSNAQTADPSAAMHWRSIGPVRAGRARAAVGVPSQPNVFYAGFDNGGVWRSTDYGANWVPLFDDQPTGSIGAIAVAPSDPNVIYVGTGAGIIRPDLAVGDGVYKSTDAGKSWIHLGLHDSQMIAMIDVDPRNPDRLFVAVLGHPYGPNPERGVFRSIDGGRSFQKVLYKDEYTSANDVRIDPRDPSVVYATLWQQQEAFIEGRAFGGSGNGIYKSTDGGDSWKQLTDGLPTVIQANLAIAPSNPRLLYATVAGTTPDAAARTTTGVVGFYKSTDAGEHWHLAVEDPTAPAGTTSRTPDPRPLARIGGGDLPTIVVDPKNENVVYSSSTVFWRTEDGGLTWSAVRGAPGGDDYQRTWINPNDPNIILAVADQGAVVSANRGASWSNWYNQSTAAMYHVSVDDAFPYRVCGGQQDSGSACVDSRSDDGEITFHDWHPVNIQEYGIAAPDPKDPDMVYGSGRTNVSLYNRRTRQTTQVGPGTDQRGTDFGRNVRTMPIAWSPKDPGLLFYATNVVWRSADHAHSWTRISPDLARQTWTPPASAGKYAGSIAPAPLGSITALSPSPRSVGVIWAGTDDGNIQVTSNGGTTWTNVTPPQIKPWTRIFNIDAGHFDTRTAYAAANTLRIDDLSPHLWRTHDGGKIWTEIDSGIADGAVANSIREDPRQRGLLYASTDTQVWVSYDDGDHWQSLRLDMPAISVRDLLVKDDTICHCSDLIAGTHGRGFWILDDVTPLRQAAAIRAAQSARSAYLVEPATALRVRFGTNDPTPWPPELPAGENPPAGGILDYYLAADAGSPVKLDIIDASGSLVRSYSSTDPRLIPDPALDPAAYDKICQQNPSAPECGLPLYWPAPQTVVSTRAGAHRVTWDLRFDPIGAPAAPSGEDASGAVPHHTHPAVNSPWAPPGRYTVRLTVDGRSYTQPLSLRLDPRVKTSASALAQLASLSRELYDGAKATHADYLQARALVAALGTAPGADAVFRASVDSLAPAATRGGRGFGRRGGSASSAAPTLEGASNAMLAAAMAMQDADVAPTASQISAAERAREQARAATERWNALRTNGLAALNAKRKAAGQPAIVVPEVKEQD